MTSANFFQQQSKNNSHPPTMKHFGLIGNPLSHSLSKRLFDTRFSAQGDAMDYHLFQLPNMDNFRQWVIENNLSGINVTIPFKIDVIPILDDLTPTAQAIGAVNCISIEDGRFVGHNTDAPAFKESLEPLLQPYHTSALILGTGGASRAVGYALQLLGIDILNVSRNPIGNQISYTDAIANVQRHHLIINCTPVGMGHFQDDTPWNEPHLLTERHLCYDLIYNPAQTRFLRESERQGAQTKNGEEMLTLQAQLSWKFWKILQEK